MTPMIQMWTSIILSSATLLSVLVGAVRVISRNTTEWKLKELRIRTIESEVAMLKGAVTDLSSIKVKLNEVATEMTRVRDRLDRFLDAPRMLPTQ